VHAISFLCYIWTPVNVLDDIEFYEKRVECLVS
jgi:hypothetical protein